jgi:hypothetical protein
MTNPRYMTFEQREAAILDGRLSVSGAKGDDRARSAEANSLSLQNTLMNVFTKNLGSQTQILNFLSAKMTNQVSNPQGYTPQALAAANTQATEGTARDFNAAQKATQEFEAQRGGSALPSGVEAQITGQNANAAAQEQASAQNQIQLANADQQQKNYWNAVGMLSGTAQMFNPQSYAGASTGAGEDVANNSNANTQASKTGFLSTLASGLGQGLGAGLSTFATGGLSSLAGIPKG